MEAFVAGVQTVRTQTSLKVQRQVGFTGHASVGKIGRRKCRISMAEPQVAESSVSYTYYEGNSWNLKVGGKNVLVDPIVSDLQFGNSTIYNQKKTMFSNDDDPQKVLPAPDLLLISQSLPDHLHLPTLRKLKRSTRVLTTPAAAEILHKEGFSNVKAIQFGQSSMELDGEVEILATAGPILGPPWQLPENGYLLKLKSSGISIFYEPHSNPQPGALANLSADYLVAAYDFSMFTPAKYTLVSGADGVVDAARELRPKKIFTINNITLTGTGLLKNFIKATGSVDELRQTLQKAGINSEIVNPRLGEPQRLDSSDILSNSKNVSDTR